MAGAWNDRRADGLDPPAAPTTAVAELIMRTMTTTTTNQRVRLTTTP